MIQPDEFYNYNYAQIANAQWAAQVENLKSAGLLSPDNLTDASVGTYESDTKPLLIDSVNKQMTVKTPKTEGVVFDIPGTITLTNLTVSSSEGGALVAVSALDKNANGVIVGKDLINSKCMLVVLSTDAQNSGMTFSDATGTTLQTLGTQPVKIKPIKVKLTLKNNYSNNLKLWSTDLRGQRKDVIPMVKTKTGTKVTGVEFELDIRSLSHGATTYFELGVI